MAAGSAGHYNALISSTGMSLRNRSTRKLTDRAEAAIAQRFVTLRECYASSADATGASTNESIPMRDHMAGGTSPLTASEKGDVAKRSRPGIGCRTPPSQPGLRLVLSRYGMSSPALTEVDSKLPSFSKETFLIYDWPIPTPADFTCLTASELQWKSAQDAKTDIDDGADDWEDYAGDPTDYASVHAMARCVASSFVRRGQRAFRAGKTFDEFAFRERTIDSTRKTRMLAALEKSTVRKSLVLQNGLDNAFRLDVFDALEVRLREEIWGEPLEEPLVEPFEEQYERLKACDTKCKKGRKKR